MGGALKIVGKIADIAKPFVSMINPLAGAALGFASDLAKGKNPLQSLMGAVSSFIPGGPGGILNNVLGKFGGAAGLMDGMGGNSLLSGALNLATGKSSITDILSKLRKSVTGCGGLTPQGNHHAGELVAHSMAQIFA